MYLVQQHRGGNVSVQTSILVVAGGHNRPLGQHSTHPSAHLAYGASAEFECGEKESTGRGGTKQYNTVDTHEAKSGIYMMEKRETTIFCSGANAQQRHTEGLV